MKYQSILFMTYTMVLSGCVTTPNQGASYKLSNPSIAATNHGHEPWVYEGYDEFNDDGEHTYSYRVWKLKGTHIQIVDRRYPSTNRRYFYVQKVMPVDGERPDIFQFGGTAWSTLEPQEIPPVYEIIPNAYFGTRLHLKDGRLFFVITEARDEVYSNPLEPLAVFTVIDEDLHVAHVDDWYKLFTEHVTLRQSYIENGWTVNLFTARFVRNYERMRAYYQQR